MLMALASGKPLSAGDLAHGAGIAASTASSHLALLLAHDLITVTEMGRHRYYRLATPHVESVLEALASLAPRRPVTSLQEHHKSRALRAGRTCYGHLAGRLGVELLRELVDRGWITNSASRNLQPAASAREAHEDERYLLSDRGAAALRDAGIPHAALSTRRPLQHCIDWTEQDHHLAGRLGREITDRLLATGAITPGSVPRSVRRQSSPRDHLTDALGSTG